MYNLQLIILNSILVHFVHYRYKVPSHRVPNHKVPICKGPNNKLLTYKFPIVTHTTFQSKKIAKFFNVSQILSRSTNFIKHHAVTINNYCSQVTSLSMVLLKWIHEWKRNFFPIKLFFPRTQMSFFVNPPVIFPDLKVSKTDCNIWLVRFLL